MSTARLTVALLLAALSTLEVWSAAAATIYVDASAGPCSNYDPVTRRCSGGSGTVFPTIAGAASNAVPGTTILIRGGTYFEQIKPLRSGTPGNFITFKAYPGETVSLTNNLPILFSPMEIELSGVNWIVIDGIHVEGVLWLEFRGSHSNVVQNCVFKRTPATGTTGNARFVQSHFNVITNNLFENGQDNLLFIDANYNRMLGNTLLQGRHSLLGIRCGDFNVIRGNYFSNSLQKIMEVYDCGEDTSAVPNSYNSTHHNLIENNIFAQTSGYYSSSGGNGIQYSGQDGIIRRNIFHHCNVGLGMGSYADEALFNVNNRVNHNVFYQNELAGISLGVGTVSNLFKNNIIAGNLGAFPDGFGLSPGQIVYRQPMSEGLRFENNDLFYHATGDPVLEEEFGAGSTVAQFSELFAGLLMNTVEADPSFMNAAAHDFSLRPGSLMIDAGAFLTRTSGTGQGTRMTVLDPFHFYDGFGISGEEGDWVQLQGQSQKARVLHVDYAGRTLTLDRSLNWLDGQKLSLAFNGSAPDLGAFEFTTPRVNVRAQGHNLILTWPAACVGYRLETSDSLASTQWQTLPAAVLQGDLCVVTNAMSSGRQFFRLVH